MKKGKTYFVLLCVFSILASFLTALNTSLKVIPIVCIYVLLCQYYRKYRTKVELKGISRIIFYAYVVYCTFLIIRSILVDDNSGLLGNYILSLFGNLEFGILSWALPAIILVSWENNILQSYKKICDIVVLLGVISGCLYLASIDHSLYSRLFYLVPVVCPRLLIYNNHRYLYMLYFVFSFYYCYTEGERSILGMEALCILGLFFFLIFQYKMRLLKVVKLYSCVVPILGVTLTTVNLVTGDSIFTILENKYGDKSSMVQDTRTFLFRELNEDLTNTDSWLYGKGILGTYYSQVMHNALIHKNYSDNENRLGTECGHLWLLLKGGILYAILYILLFYVAILKGNRSNNVFLIFLSFIMANRLLMMFISFTPSFDLLNIMIWLFMSFCIQSRFLLKK